MFERVLVYGAGGASADLVASLLGSPGCRLVPVGVLDDAPDLTGPRLGGVPMLGGRYQIAKAARLKNAQRLVINLRSASADRLAEVRRLASEAGLAVAVVSFGESDPAATAPDQDAPGPSGAQLAQCWRRTS